MGELIEIFERRIYRRFPAKERAFVYLGSELGDMLYHLIEISGGGLSFRYLGEEVLTKNLSKLSLVMEDDFYVAALPVETVSDIRLVNSYIPFRRKSVRFCELSPRSKSQLFDFIINNTEKYTILLI